MSVVAIRGRDPITEARALLDCVLRDGDIIGTDDAGRMRYCSWSIPGPSTGCLPSMLKLRTSRTRAASPSPMMRSTGRPPWSTSYRRSGATGRHLPRRCWRSFYSL
jgi:hypothetical protein